MTAMQLFEEALDQVARVVWTDFLGCALERAPAAGPTPVGASVAIRGEWEGVVVVRCSEPLARRAAAAMWGVAPDAADRAQVDDALGELANMIAGNLKALIPPPSALGLPEADLELPAGARPRGDVEFLVEGEPLRVSVLECALPTRA
jgi:chemotaxis protein CheX